MQQHTTVQLHLVNRNGEMIYKNVYNFLFDIFIIWSTYPQIEPAVKKKEKLT